MKYLKKNITQIADNRGADLIGFASIERLNDSPPSGDPSYLLSDAKSIISFAVSLDPEHLENFISKKDWLSHCHDRKKVVRQLYEIGDAIAEYLTAQGYEAINVDINNNYRSEDGASDITEMTEFHPEFSHRYGAVAAGIGRLGWSGNIMTEKFGARVELGTVICSAEFESDPLLNENPCDQCRMCSSVCPVAMINPKEYEIVRVSGFEEKISRKRPNTCCWIGCTGYEGLSENGKWSNWSPYRLDSPLPEDKAELDQLCISLQKKDPQMNTSDNIFSDYRKAVFNPDWFYYTVCGFCRSVCSASHEDRLKNRKLIVDSGKVSLRSDGMHVVSGNTSVKIKTPYIVDVEYERDIVQDNGNLVSKFPLDNEVLSFLNKKRNKS